MAKLVTLSMTALMAATLAACGSDGGNSGGSESKTSGEDTTERKSPVMTARRSFIGISVQKARTKMLLQRQ